MLRARFYCIYGIFLFSLAGLSAQIEESAEVFLEAYTDEFQEHFFEGLKQRGIENYDRAIAAFLMCKNLDPSNAVVDHELAKSYRLDNQAVRAMEYANQALLSEPANRWYLDTYITIALEQGYQLAQIKSFIPYEDSALKTNLALILFREKQYEEALKIIAELPQTTYTKQLASKTRDSLATVGESEVDTGDEPGPSDINNPVQGLKEQLNGLRESQNYFELEREAMSATERFPSQPEFYYYHGLALRQLKEYQRAIRSLEAALDYIIEDRDLTNAIYRELAGTYMDLGNSSKANMYLSKIKTGL